VYRRCNAGKVHPLHIATPDAEDVHARYSSHQPRCQLILAHLQREHRHPLLLVDGSVLRNVQGERGLADRRTGSKDGEV
jgi:hypothetical protein